VVGDEDQSIYSWRGADIRNILDFERDYPDATVIRLEQNYRSTKRILSAAGAVVANNVNRKGKDLWTQGAEGSALLVHESYGAEQEALFVAGYIDRYLRQHPDEHAAALYRTNAQSRQIEEALRRYNRNYKVVGGVSFYQRAEVKDLIAYLKLAVSPSDSISFLRVINTPARGIGKTTIDKIAEYAQPRKNDHQNPVGPRRCVFLVWRAHTVAMRLTVREHRRGPVRFVLSHSAAGRPRRYMSSRQVMPQSSYGRGPRRCPTPTRTFPSE
jgi:DNA helicase-2/ATP-dependent DNA helicase PcrA